jgi:hypothetical protein
LRETSALTPFSSNSDIEQRRKHSLYGTANLLFLNFCNRAVADLSLDKEVLKAVFSKNGWSSQLNGKM